MDNYINGEIDWFLDAGYFIYLEFKKYYFENDLKNDFIIRLFSKSDLDKLLTTSRDLNNCFGYNHYYSGDIEDYIWNLLEYPRTVRLALAILEQNNKDDYYKQYLFNEFVLELTDPLFAARLNIYGSLEKFKLNILLRNNNI